MTDQLGRGLFQTTARRKNRVRAEPCPGITRNSAFLGRHDRSYAGLPDFRTEARLTGLCCVAVLTSTLVLKTVKALGLAAPPAVLARAVRLIR